MLVNAIPEATSEFGQVRTSSSTSAECMFLADARHEDVETGDALPDYPLDGSAGVPTGPTRPSTGSPSHTTGLSGQVLEITFLPAVLNIIKIPYVAQALRREKNKTLQYLKGSYNVVQVIQTGEYRYHDPITRFLTLYVEFDFEAVRRGGGGNDFFPLAELDLY
ncbi:hypothetical protein BDZ97DRAFT_1760348 [Flammula alnicola]|nr:hypothetical protein BDZ97DRAFT_1760348 [Flammula alnicola]